MDYEKLMQDARKKISKITFNSEVEILKAYRVASFIIMKKIKENQKRGLEIEYYQNVNDELEEVVSILNNRLSDSIKKSIISVSDVITDVQLIFNSEVFPVNIAETANNYIKGRNMRLVQTLISGEYYKDSKSLDTRIWNITNKNKNDIQTLIASNIAKGVNSRELAKVIDNYVNPTTRTQAKTVVSGMSRNISYQAQRLARTSITQTANEANRESAKENVFCQGLKWNLSSSHYERQIKRWGPDICDVYANQNNYNLGQGVFPIEEYPISHPN
ncbi:hypothetical protein, partial [Peptostreptococcus sp. D1]|uniref:hypothetical protein n=1 Tax=Peptostreptococcus sp. D1 TaxID=72304 RepID=UPI0008F24B55